MGLKGPNTWLWFDNLYIIYIKHYQNSNPAAKVLTGFGVRWIETFRQVDIIAQEGNNYLLHALKTFLSSALREQLLAKNPGISISHNTKKEKCNKKTELHHRCVPRLQHLVKI